ncbi:MAG: hypothetical protein RIQ81_76 [Pseudomonadota bacterium]|jgi:uncharacterized secreted protein with C-terminal beta-propeller domain
MHHHKVLKRQSMAFTATLAAFLVGACDQQVTAKRSFSGESQHQPTLAVSPIEMFKSCEELTNHLLGTLANIEQRRNIEDRTPWNASTRIGTPADSLPSSAANSEIIGNRQERGVAEADFTAVGKHHIVIARRNKLTILHRKSLTYAGKLYQASGQQITGIYIDGDRLAVIVNDFRTGSSISIFSLAENAGPSLIVEKKFEHPVINSRVTGGHLVAIFQYQLTGKEKPEGGKVAGVECTSVAKPQVDAEGLGLTRVLALNLHSPEKQESIVAALAASSRIYMNEENLYLSENPWNDVTGIHKIRFDAQSGTLQFTASGKAPGFMQDDFAMREVTLAGTRYLVLATNSKYKPDAKPTMGGWTDEPVSIQPMPMPSARANNLFIIKQEGATLLEAGKVTGIAPGENIMAVRYVDEMAYVVTFRQTDPLYAISLKDPAAPKILGELKIPGFSEYLHPVADGRLLGVGVEATESGRRTGEVKVSLFDTSKPEDLKEKSVIKKQGQSEANHDYKAFMYDPEMQTAFVPVSGGAMILDVGTDVLAEKVFITQSGQIRRAFKFDGMLFTVSTEQIVARDLNEPGKILLKSPAL